MDISNKKLVFHIHTNYSSDCNSRPSEIVDFLVERGVEIAIITDHNAIEGAQEAKLYADSKYKEKIQVIIGEEVLSDVGDIIGFPILKEIPTGKYQDIISNMKAQNAKICLPHPYKSHDLFLIHDDKFISEFDFIEVFNSRLKDNLNFYAEKLCKKFQKIPIIGNDAHTIEDLDNCYLKYNEEMLIIDSYKGKTKKRNIRKSQVINTKKKKKIPDIFKYQLLRFINK